MITVLTVFHVLISLVLIFIVLVQGGKGADMGAAFGGGSQAVFGPSSGSTFFTKLTTTIAALFMINSIVLAKLTTYEARKSVIPAHFQELQNTPTDDVNQMINTLPKADEPAGKPAKTEPAAVPAK